MQRAILFLLSAITSGIAGSYATSISWSPDEGYQSDEVELSGLLPEEIQRVLDWMNQGRAFEEAGKDKKALKRFRRVHKRFPKSQYAPEALHRTAQIRLDQNNIDKAFEALELIAWVYPNYGSFNDTIGEMYKIASERMDSYRVKIFGVIPGFLNRDRAIKYFERIVHIAPYSDYAPLALMNIAQAWDKKSNDTMAIFALDRLITNYPNSFLTPDAYLKLAETHASLIRGPYYDQGNTEDAITYFEDFMIQYPGNARVNEAESGLADSQDVKALSKVKIADFYFHKRDNIHAAKVLYNEAITIAPLSTSAEMARRKLEIITAREEGPEVGPEAPAAAEATPGDEIDEKKAQKRAKRKVLGIF